MHFFVALVISLLSFTSNARAFLIRGCNQNLYVLYEKYIDCMHPNHPHVDKCLLELNEIYKTNQKEYSCSYLSATEKLKNDDPYPIVNFEFTHFLAEEIFPIVSSFRKLNEREINERRKELLSVIKGLKLGDIWKVRDTLFHEKVVDMKCADPKMARLSKESTPLYFSTISPEIKLRMLRGVFGAVGKNDAYFNQLKFSFGRDMAIIMTALKFAGPFMQKFIQRLDTMATEDSKEHLAKFTSSIPPMSDWERSIQLEKAGFREKLHSSLAGGSIAEVYSTTYHGKKAVLKLQRWNIKNYLESDIEFFKPAFQKLGDGDHDFDKDSHDSNDKDGKEEKKGWFSGFCKRDKKQKAKEELIQDLDRPQSSGESMLAEIKEGLYQEIDFKTEYDNLKKMGESYKKYDKKFGTIDRLDIMRKDKPVILLMTAASGDSVSNILSKNTAKLDVIEDVYRKLVDLLSHFDEEAIFKSGYFHGDLHAGNIFYDAPSKRLTLIDFGKIGKLEKREQKLLIQLSLAFKFSGKMRKWLIKRVIKKAMLNKSFNNWRKFNALVDHVIKTSTNPGNNASILILKCSDIGLSLSQNVMLYGWSRSMLTKKIQDLEKELKDKGRKKIPSSKSATNKFLRRNMWKISKNGVKMFF